MNTKRQYLDLQCSLNKAFSAAMGMDDMEVCHAIKDLKALIKEKHQLPHWSPRLEDGTYKSEEQMKADDKICKRENRIASSNKQGQPIA